MTSPDLRRPSPISAIEGDDVARVEQWVARQRAELSRLLLAARSAVRRAERAEREAEEAERDAPRLPAPEGLLSVIDSMLDKSVRRADLAVEAARRHAAATVAVAHERVTEQQHALGFDPHGALGPSGWTSSTIPDVARPASGRELWQTVRVEALAAGRPVLEPVRAAVALPVSADRPTDHDPLPVSSEDGRHFDDVELVLDDAELFQVVLDGAPRRPPVRQVVPAALGPPDRSVESSALVVPSTGRGPLPRAADVPELFDVFWRGEGLEDVFWGEAENSRRPSRDRVPIRDRLRRRVTQGQP